MDADEKTGWEYDAATARGQIVGPKQHPKCRLFRDLLKLFCLICVICGQCVFLSFSRGLLLIAFSANPSNHAVKS
jgi:hypothetical protein